MYRTIAWICTLALVVSAMYGILQIGPDPEINSRWVGFLQLVVAGLTAAFAQWLTNGKRLGAAGTAAIAVASTLFLIWLVGLWTNASQFQNWVDFGGFILFSILGARWLSRREAGKILEEDELYRQHRKDHEKDRRRDVA